MGDSKDIQPIKNPVPLIFKDFVLEQVEVVNLRGASSPWFT